MPDYTVIKSLCGELKVTVSELMDAEETEEKSVRVYDDDQILDLLRRTQELEKQKVMLTGVILIVMGIALQALSQSLGGSDVKDFFSGLLLEPARRYSNPEDHRAAGLCRPQNCRIKQKNPGGCRGSFALSCICWQRHHTTPRIFLTLFRTSAGSRPEPFTLPAISCASTSAGSGSAGFAATPWMVQ